MNIDQLRAALANQNVQAFLRVIRAGETNQTDDAYRMMYGGALAPDLAQHPGQAFKSPWGWTSAAGAYQFMAAVPGKVKTDTWGECVRALGLTDFSPQSQDLAAVFLIDRRKALAAVLAGRLYDAIALCNREWASLPGSPYGQPTRTTAQARDIYLANGGTFEEVTPIAAPKETEPQPEPAKDADMLPLIPLLSAILPTLAQNIPALGKLFGSGSEVNERNVKAASLAVDIVQQAVGASNAQQAAEIITADPAMAKVANAAVESSQDEINAAFGAAEAHAAELAFIATGAKPWDSTSFWAMCILVPLVYIVTLSIVGVIGNAEWAAEMRASISTMIVSLILGGVGGYYFGSATTRNKPPGSK
jgi:muramidase (phage lysozyme)